MGKKKKLLKKKHGKKKLSRNSSTVIMRKLGLNIEEPSIEKIVAEDENFLFSESSKFDLSLYKDGMQEIKCPHTNTSLMSLVKYIKNAHITLEEIDVNEENTLLVINFKRSLIRLLIYGNELLTARVYLENYSSRELAEEDATIVHNTDVFDSPDSHIFLLILRCCIFIQYFYEFDDVTCSKDFPYIIDNYLIPLDIADKPITQFDIKELLDCYNVIGWDWHKLRYDEQLTLFLDFLLYRYAELALVPMSKDEIPEFMFNENSILIEMPGRHRGYFLPHSNVLRDHCWQYQSMWKKLEITSTINYHSGKYNLTQLPVFSTAQRKLLWERLKKCDTDQIIVPDFRTMALNLLIRPGERDHYLNTQPNASKRVDLVVRSRLGEHELTEKWMEYLSLDTIKIARNLSHFGDLNLEEEKEQGEEDEYFDECISDCAVIQLAQFYITTALGKPMHRIYFWNYFDLFEMAGDLDSQLNRPYPLVLQNFNWYGIYYKNKFYSHKDALDTLLHWLYIIWMNSNQYEESKYFAYTSIGNLRINDYKFETCDFRAV